MSKLDELIDTYLKEASKLGLSVNEDLLVKVAKELGPSIYNADAAKVSSSDQSELDRVKSNFLIKKLGLPDTPDLDKAIGEVVEQLGKSNTNKYRVLFYYLLVTRFKKESAYS
jgi:hypothetical protein